jgi:predicted nucleic acid-binding protein
MSSSSVPARVPASASTSAEVALADTSIFIARENGRPIAAALPRTFFVSSITLAELSLGILGARDERTRSRRLQTLLMASNRRTLPIDRVVASAWSEMMAAIAATGHPLPKARVNDSWIAATARAYRLPVVTQDAGFRSFPGIMVIHV